MNKTDAIKHVRAARDSAVANLEALKALRSAVGLPSGYGMGEAAVQAQIDALNQTLDFLDEGGDA